MRDDWVKIEVGKAGKVISGGTPKTSNADYWGDEIPWVTPADLSGYNQKFISKGRKSITAKGLKNSSAKLMPSNSVLFSSRAPIGYVAIVKNEICTNQGFKSLVPFDCLNSEFIYYYFKSIKQKAENHASGTTFKELSAKAFSALPLPIAPLPEQRAIVAKIEKLFSDLDNGIANLKAAKAKLDIYRQAVLKKAFAGELTKEWREQNPYSEKSLVDLLGHIKNFNSKKKGQNIPRRLPPMDLTDLPKLAFGWIWSEAYKICQSVRDGTHDTPKYVKEGVPLVTSKNLKNCEIDLTDVDLISEKDHEEICKRSAVEKDDILYGMIGTIGNPAIVKSTNTFSIKNVGLFKKNPELIKPKYLQLYLSSWLVEHIMRQKELIRGTTQKFVALGGLRVLPIPLPSIKEQEQIIYAIESRLSVCDKLAESIDQGLEKAEALRQSILKKALAGHLLSEAELEACRREPDWEPAEKLLERIKKDKR